jgi:hypothetical protein
MEKPAATCPGCASQRRHTDNFLHLYTVISAAVQHDNLACGDSVRSQQSIIIK